SRCHVRCRPQSAPRIATVTANGDRNTCEFPQSIRLRLSIRDQQVTRSSRIAGSGFPNVDHVAATRRPDTTKEMLVYSNLPGEYEGRCTVVRQSPQSSLSGMVLGRRHGGAER